MNSIESQRNLHYTKYIMNNIAAANELADTLELLLLDLTEGWDKRYAYPGWIQEGLEAIHRYRVRTGTQRVRPAAAVVRD